MKILKDELIRLAFPVHAGSCCMFFRGSGSFFLHFGPAFYRLNHFKIKNLHVFQQASSKKTARLMQPAPNEKALD